MNTLDINEENILAYLAYKELGGKTNSNTFFGQYLGSGDFIEYILKSKELSSHLLREIHTQLDSKQKLKLLNRFVNDRELLEKFISHYKVKLTIEEYKVIIPQVVTKFPTLIEYMLDIKTDFIKKLKLDKEIEDKLISLLVMYKLS
jgi:hypothetical protein